MRKRSNGEGTIFKRKDGRWCGAYYDEDYIRHYVYAKTQTEVKAKLMEKKKSVSIKACQDLTLQEWMEEFLEKYKKNELKITTYDSYLYFYRKYIKDSRLGKTKLSSVNTETLQKYYNDKIRDGYNSKTVREIGTIINSALDKAVKLKMLSENPNLYTSIPKKIKYEAKVLSREDVDRIVADAKGDELYPIIVTTVYTGLRKGEVMALKWESVDFEERKIYVKGSLCRLQDTEPDEKGRRHSRYEILEPKTKKSIRMIPMLDIVYDALMEQKNRQEAEKIKYADIYEDQGFVFADKTGKYLAQRPFMRKYHDFLKRYGIANIRFHDLRHTFASLLIESDVSMKVVQELLGHSSITTSMDIYTHVSERKKERALNSMIKMEDDGKRHDVNNNNLI